MRTCSERWNAVLSVPVLCDAGVPFGQSECNVACNRFEHCSVVLCIPALCNAGVPIYQLWEQESQGWNYDAGTLTVCSTGSKMWLMVWPVAILPIIVHIWKMAKSWHKWPERVNQVSKIAGVNVKLGCQGKTRCLSVSAPTVSLSYLTPQTKIQNCSVENTRNAGL